jgi:hypothetical protein
MNFNKENLKEVTTIDKVTDLVIFEKGSSVPKRIKKTNFDSTASDILGYTSYSMLLTQTGTNAPVKTDLSGNCSGISFSYNGVGYYTCTGTGLFTLNKTQIVFGQVYNIQVTSDNRISVDSVELGLNSFEFNTFDSTGTAANAILANTMLEIKVYN